jgi:galactoside 2-L-fucosyltransferase 1/2
MVRQYFNITMPTDKGNTIQSSKETKPISVTEVKPAIYNNQTAALPDRNVSLHEYLQSWKYFIEAEDQLRRELTFKEHILSEARNFLDASTPEKWRKLDIVRVVIHVRRGDHTTPAQQQAGWPVATAEYFNRSMNCVRSCFGDRVQFVVLSEDTEWCTKNIVGPDVVFSRGHLPVVDMAIASLCDHAIITIGSYGIWCAWFANGVTITQKEVGVPGSKLASRGFPREDYYKPSSVGL